VSTGLAIAPAILRAKFLVIVLVFIVEKFFLVNKQYVFYSGAEGASACILAGLVGLHAELRGQARLVVGQVARGGIGHGHEAQAAPRRGDVYEHDAH
jgi:hypothetical protein